MKSDKLIDAMSDVREDYLEALTEGRENLVVQEGGRKVSRRNFLRVGAAAAAVGVASFLGLSIFGKDDTLQIFGDNGSEQRGFVLTAMAEELVSEDGTKFPVKNVITSQGQAPSDAYGMYDAEYRFDVYGKVLGAGSGTITYELEGAYAQDIAHDNLAGETFIFFGSHNDGFFSDLDGYQYTKKRSHGFVAAEASVDPFWTPLTIKAHFPMSDALKAAVESGDKRAEFIEARHCFNQVLAETTLRITVAYENSDEFPGITAEYGEGDVFEVLYAIEPIATFDETFGEYIDKLLALEDQGLRYSPYGAAVMSGDVDYQQTDEAEVAKELEHIEDEYWFYTIREIDS